MTPQNIYLGCPTHDGRIDFRTARSIYETASKNNKLYIAVNQSSLLAQNCNNLWSNALNLRDQLGLQWFALIHSDIAPEPLWLDKMISLAIEHEADLLSAIVPIKDFEGNTSTAIFTAGEYYPYARLTQKQVNHPEFPDTFDIDLALNALTKDLPAELRTPGIDRNSAKLMTNTGLMVVRLDRPWSENLYFYMKDEIFTNPNGKLQAMCMPEDWNFSMDVGLNGGKVMATKAIEVHHCGTHYYHSRAMYGNNIDKHCPDSKLKKA